VSLVQTIPNPTNPIPWIVLGSSPLAPRAYAKACEDAIERVVITCNRGLAIEPDPDFYFLADSTACLLFADDAKAASKRGTICVTLQRAQMAMERRRVEWFPLIVRNGPPFEAFQMSGLWCIEFAIIVGKAQRVWLCGCDGYTAEYAEERYFEGARPFPDQGPKRHHTTNIVQPVTQKLCRKYPAVEFRLYGEPHYAVEAANWEVHAA